MGGNAGAGYEWIVNAYFAVDSFFFLSGLLLSYFSFKELDKGQFSYIVFFIHRYIR